ncbi:hypothetical protein Nit79A3_1332 [Nitrosomonas sp. Is79A3]|uniref:hypothetical protein n=1 Tax=Nitrosomonas sp. (strain Is79A3) TaxID=261292 RepID=UPI000215CDF9
MTDITSPKNAVPASISFDVKYMQKGKHSVILILPEAYHAPIGLIVAYWGNFEVIFDSCLEGLIIGEIDDGKVRETKGWKHKGFKKRRELFKDICDEWLASWDPAAAAKLTSIIDSASHLHSRRNLIDHGTYGYTIPAQSSIAKGCYAYSNATEEKMPFDEHILKKIYHDISHTTANLVRTFSSFGKVEGQFHTLPDSEILRIYRETTHPWNPNPAKRPTEL